jgi:hypothetical protein
MEFHMSERDRLEECIDTIRLKSDQLNRDIAVLQAVLDAIDERIREHLETEAPVMRHEGMKIK